MSPTSCQTAPPRARWPKIRAPRGKLCHFRPPCVNPKWLLIPWVRERSRGIRHLPGSSRGAAFQNRLSQGSAVHVLELSTDRKAARDARYLDALAREQPPKAGGRGFSF